MVPETVLVKDQAGTSPTDQPYGSLVGALLFVAVCSRPDIAFAVTRLTKFISSPAEQHWTAALQVLAFLFKTRFCGVELGFKRKGGGLPNIEGYADSDWAGDGEDRKSVSGGVVMWGAVAFALVLDKTGYDSNLHNRGGNSFCIGNGILFDARCEID
jgi:hypothetical protein